MRVLVIEDGTEYTETLSRFLSVGFTWSRAGSGPRALAWLAENQADAIYLDMRFDRAPLDELLGDLEATSDRFNGDAVQGQRFLEDHQGTYILEAIRASGCRLPVLFSHDFDDQPRRWSRIAEKYGPVDYLPDNSTPDEVARRLSVFGAHPTRTPQDR